MLNFDEIKELLSHIDKSTAQEVTFEYGTLKINVKKQSENQVVLAEPQKVVQAQVPQVVNPQVVVNPTATVEAQPKVVTEQKEDTSNYLEIKSPMVGTFYAAPNPEAPPYVVKGQRVNKNTMVCIVEAMKLFNEIEAEVEGEIVEILAESGQLVEYGQTLFRVKPL